MSSAKRKKTSSVKSARGVPTKTQILLYVRAGGRCEFDGCNAYLLKHHLTHLEGNYGQTAHIVAFSSDGPRGQGTRPANVHAVSNLMLLCGGCHKLIDSHADKYSVETLQKYKKDHEDRVFVLTGYDKDRDTTIVVVKSKIGGNAVAIPEAETLRAVAPRYTKDQQGVVIDLTGLDDNAAGYLELAKKEIKKRTDRLFDPSVSGKAVGHISLFALAPIPLLAFLGSQLSNKVAIDLFQRHRDTEDWVWKNDGKQVNYTFRQKRTGTRRSGVALLLSLSGAIKLSDLPESVRRTYNIYEIGLSGMNPTPTFLRQKSDLETFRIHYQSSLRQILRKHPNLKRLELFPAAPAPIAVLCGRELLPKHDPPIDLYDYRKSEGGFAYALTIND